MGLVMFRMLLIYTQALCSDDIPYIYIVILACMHACKHAKRA